MTDKQIKLLGLFKEIDKICKDNDIEYYLAGGTLLGAVRHRGYIPWDDDMDLLMTRNNWEKFVVACETQMSPDRKLVCPDLDREYCNMFPRYVDRTSTAIHSAQVFFNDVAGFVIDVFVLDPIPDDDESYRKYLEDVMLYSDLIVPTAVYSYRWGINRYRYPFYRALMKIIGSERVYEKLEKRMFSYPEEKCSRYAMRWGGIPFIFSKEMFTGVKCLKFEDVDAEVPLISAAYLTWHYGDEWMFIPPHGEHESHDAIYSIDHNYEPVRAEIRSLVDGDVVMKSYRKRKSSIVRSMKSFHRLLDENRALKGVSVSYSVNRHFAEIKPLLMDLKNKKDYVSLYKEFLPYFTNQFSADIIGREDFANARRFYNPIYMEIKDEEILCLAVETLINVEKISKAMRFMDVVEICSGKKVAGFEELRKAVKDFRIAINNFELGKIDECTDVSKNLVEKYPHCISFIKFRIRILEKAGIADNKEEIQCLINVGREIFPSEGEFLKYDADILALSDKVTAFEKYINAYMTTTNGLIHLEINDIILDNLSDFATMIDRKSEENSEDAIKYIDAALILIPFNANIFKIKCDLLKKLIGGNKNLLTNYTRILKNYCSSPSATGDVREVFTEFIESFTKNRQIAEDIAESYLKPIAECFADYEQRSQKLKSLSGEVKLWNKKIIADDLYKMGEYKKSHMLLKEVFAESEDELLRFITVKRLLASLKYFDKNGKWKDSAAKNEVCEINTCLDDWCELYPTIMDAVNYYSEIGIIPKEGIKFIEKFGLLDFDAEWSLANLSRFTDICKSSASVLFKSENENTEKTEEDNTLFGFVDTKETVVKDNETKFGHVYDSKNDDDEEIDEAEDFDISQIKNNKKSGKGIKRHD